MCKQCKQFVFEYDSRTYRVSLPADTYVNSLVSMLLGWQGKKGQFRVVRVANMDGVPTKIALEYVGDIPPNYSMASVAHLA